MKKKWGGVFALSLLLCGLSCLSFQALAAFCLYSDSKPCGTYPNCRAKHTCYSLDNTTFKSCEKTCRKNPWEKDYKKPPDAYWSCLVPAPSPPGTTGRLNETRRIAGKVRIQSLGQCCTTTYTPRCTMIVLCFGRNVSTSFKVGPCSTPPHCTKKSCECGPDICENETCPDKVSCPCGGTTCPGQCPAKVDCPGGGIACTLAECPGKTSYPGFNIGNLILGNLPKTANQSLPPNTNVPLNQAGAVVQGALRVYVESFDDFKVCDKKGQCYKVCYSDGTNCRHLKKPYPKSEL